MPWFLYVFLAALLALPVCAVFIEDRPPSNEIVHEQDDTDPGTAEMRLLGRS